MRRLPGLDGLRALAIFGVVLYHLFPNYLGGGFLGVDVFFALSGFLITYLLLEKRSATGRISLGGFWLRRARRILPALITTVLICSTLAFVLGQDVLVNIRSQVFGAATFSSNWIFIAQNNSYFAHTQVDIFRNLWSLAVEEQAYLIWPLVLLALLALKKAWFRGFTMLILGLGSALWMGIVYTPDDPSRAYFGTDSHAFGLLLGISLALFMSLEPLKKLSGRVKPYLSLTLGILAFLGLVWLYFTLQDAGEFSYRGGMLIGVILTLLLIWVMVFTPSKLGSVFDWKPFSFIGKRSYGLYLWHWPILVLVWTASPGVPRSGWNEVYLAALTLALALPITLISYKFLEEPIRRGGFLAYCRAKFRPIRAGARLGSAALSLALIVSGSGTIAAVVSSKKETEAARFIRSGQALLKAGPNPSAPSAIPTLTPSAAITPSVKAPAPPPPPPAPIIKTNPNPGVVVPSGNQILAVGDSVMLAAAGALEDDFPGIDIQAKVSRQMWDIPQILRGLSATKQLRHVVIIGLGTNGAFRPTILNQIREIIGPNRWLLLVTPYGPKPWIIEARSVIKTWYGSGRSNTELVEWASAIAGRVDLLAPDQVHPGRAGGAIYASLVRNSLVELANRNS